jgi:hypothetical protein
MVALATPLFGQQAPPRDAERFERRLEQYQRDTRLTIDNNIPVAQRTAFDYGAYFAPSYFSLDDSVGDNHVLRQYDLIAYGRLNIDRIHEFFFLGRGTYQDFNKNDSFDGNGDDDEWNVDRAFYRLDLAQMQATRTGTTNASIAAIEAGRQLVYWGNGLTLSQIIDGGKINLGSDRLELEAIGGVSQPRTADFDSSRPQFEDDTHRGFFGATLSTQIGAHRPFVYALFQRDYNDDNILRTGAVTTRFNYNSNYFGAGSKGALGDRISYGTEFVFETGSGLSNSVVSGPTGLVQVPQTKEDISAYAGDIQLDYLVPDVRKTRLSSELLFASGDPDRQQSSNTFGGNRSGTKDHGFNAFGLLNTGLAFAPSVSNLLALRVGASTFPIPARRWADRLQVGCDLFLFTKFQQDAPIDESTSDKRYLGWEPDLFLNWQVTEDVSLAVRYGVFFPGTAISGDDSPRQAIFLGVTYAF